MLRVRTVLGEIMDEESFRNFKRSSARRTPELGHLEDEEICGEMRTVK